METHTPGQHGPTRCFKCPRERRGRDPGWYYIDQTDRPRVAGFVRVYVCPRDYYEFAASERVRWTPIADAAHEDVVDFAAARAILEERRRTG